MAASKHRVQPGRRAEVQQVRQQVDRVFRGSRTERRMKRNRIDDRKIKSEIFSVQLCNVFLRRSAQDFDDLDQLIHIGGGCKERSPDHDLSKNASGAPDVNLGRVIWTPEQEFGRSAVSRTYVGDIVLPFHQPLCAAEISELENSGFRIEQNIFRLDVPVADVLLVNVGQASEELVHHHFDQDGRDHSFGGLHLADESADGRRHELHDQTKKSFVLDISGPETNQICSFCT